MAGYDWLGGLLGRAPKEYDPYAQDRQLRMQALQGAMGQYDQMMSKPGGAIPDAYRQKMLGEVETDTRNRYAGQGQSGFTNDRVARNQNDLRMKMLDTELGQLNKQRDYMGQLIGQNQPTQQIPGQTGVLQQVGGQMIGKAATGGMNALMGQDDDSENWMKQYQKWFGGGANATQGNVNG